MSLSNCSLSVGQMVLIKYAFNTALTEVLSSLVDDGPCKSMDWVLF